LKGNYKVKDNPLPWLEWVLNGADHTNFFENRVTEYEVAGLVVSGMMFMKPHREAYE
jgi:glutaredoxin 3